MSTDSEFGTYNNKNVLLPLWIYILYHVALLDSYSHACTGPSVQCSDTEDEIFFLEVFFVCCLYFQGAVKLKPKLQKGLMCLQRHKKEECLFVCLFVFKVTEK